MQDWEFEPGIYFGLPEDQYHAAKGLSVSGMKQLAVSPLNYWHHNLNPDFERPEETYPQRFGKAVHCRLLEPERFEDAYAAALVADDLPGALVTADDLKGWLAEQGMPTTGKRKQDLIDRILACPEHPPLWDLEKERHAEQTAGKTLLKRAEHDHIERLAAVVAADPYATAALSGGLAEVSIFVRDPETDVLWKARLDYAKPNATIDLKTFSNARGKPADKAVFEAIYYESYYLQCVQYHAVRELARQQLAAGMISVHGDVPADWLAEFLKAERHGFGFVFVESAPPFDLRIVGLRHAEVQGADGNVYWMDAQLRIAAMTALYAECRAKYGDRPWREPRPPYMLEDSDLPQLLFRGGSL